MDMSDVKRPLSRSVTIVCALFIGLLCVVLSVATYRLYTISMYTRYQKQMASIVTYIESHIDHDDMSECAKTYVESETYKEFQKFFDDFIDHYDDVHYLYIMQIVEPDAPVEIIEICAANSTYEKLYEPDLVMHLGDGEEGWYDKETAQKFREILAGDEDAFVVNGSEWGVDYTLARPLVNSRGEHYGLLCADVSIDQINSTVYRTIYTNIAMIVIPGILFIFLLILWLRRHVTEPLHQLENSVAEFAHSSAGSRNPDDLSFCAPDIHTGNEVESLTNAITKLSEDMKEYAKGIAEAEQEAKGLQDHVTEMNEIVYQDALTHVKNRASYEEVEKELRDEIAGKNAEFGIVMADLNSLKEINDQYGHDKGNKYIVGTCNMLCNTFLHSPVYRVGGDEFVVVLKGRDYQNRETLLDEIRAAYERTMNDTSKEPWHRYSAAVGMGVYQPGDDVEAVFSRADQAMYEAKAEIKQNA